LTWDFFLSNYDQTLFMTPATHISYDNPQSAITSLNKLWRKSSEDWNWQLATV